mgnify:CR=1 FL=1
MREAAVVNVGMCGIPLDAPQINDRRVIKKPMNLNEFVSMMYLKVYAGPMSM